MFMQYHNKLILTHLIAVPPIYCWFGDEKYELKNKGLLETTQSRRPQFVEPRHAMLFLIPHRCLKTGVSDSRRQCVGGNFAGFDLYDGFIRKGNSRIGDTSDFGKYSLYFRNASTSRHVRHRQRNLLNCGNGCLLCLSSFGFLSARLLFRLTSKYHDDSENTD